MFVFTQVILSCFSLEVRRHISLCTVYLCLRWSQVRRSGKEFWRFVVYRVYRAFVPTVESSLEVPTVKSKFLYAPCICTYDEFILFKCEIELICLMFFIFSCTLEFWNITDVGYMYCLWVLSHTWKKCNDKQEPKQFKKGILDSCLIHCLSIDTEQRSHQICWQRSYLNVGLYITKFRLQLNVKCKIISGDNLDNFFRLISVSFSTNKTSSQVANKILLNDNERGLI